MHKTCIIQSDFNVQRILTNFTNRLTENLFLKKRQPLLMEINDGCLFLNTRYGKYCAVGNRSAFRGLFTTLINYHKHATNKNKQCSDCENQRC